MGTRAEEATETIESVCQYNRGSFVQSLFVSLFPFKRSLEFDANKREKEWKEKKKKKRTIRTFDDIIEKKRWETMKKRMHAIVRIETISKHLEKKGETCRKKVKRKREKKKELPFSGETWSPSVRRRQVHGNTHTQVNQLDVYMHGAEKRVCWKCSTVKR